MKKIIAVLLLLSITLPYTYAQLDPAVAQILKQVNAYPFDVRKLKASQLRKMMDAGIRRMQMKIEKLPKVEDRTIGQESLKVPVRIYSPSLKKNLPVIVFYHGGGWAMGSLDTHDPFCRTIAKTTGAIVVAVGYRLAPENPFPAGFNDAFAVVKWLTENAPKIGANAHHMAVMGDSAGGNLAAAVALKAGKQKIKLRAQVLLYPATNLATLTETDSYKRFGKGYILTADQVELFRGWYTPNLKDRNNPAASPAKARRFRRVVPALVITAGFDPLHDDGAAYAQLLQKKKVKVQHKNFPGMIHGFVTMDMLKQAAVAKQIIADYLKNQFENVK